MIQLTGRQATIVRLVCFGLVCLTVPGCGPRPVTQMHEVVLPDSFEADGTSWTRQPWSDKHDKSLDSFFKKQMYLAENPAFQGERVCYEDNSGTHRCYWVTAVGDSSRWILLEFHGTKFQPAVEGQGAPFDQLQRKAP